MCVVSVTTLKVIEKHHRKDGGGTEAERGGGEGRSEGGGEAGGWRGWKGVQSPIINSSEINKIGNSDWNIIQNDRNVLQLFFVLVVL